MKLTAIGHASWAVSNNDGALLIDPNISNSFGTTGSYRFEFVPARRVTLSSAPKFNAVVLTSEHIQHFHIPSLVELSRNGLIASRVFVPWLFPFCAEKSLLECGFSVYRADDWCIAGSLRFKLFQADKKTFFRDSRSASLLISESDSLMAIQSDVVFPDALIEQVSLEKKAVTLIVTNNFHRIICSRSHGLAGWDNKLPVREHRYENITGLRLLEEIVVNPCKTIPFTKAVVISGNGFQNPSLSIDPMWSNCKLASIASALSLSLDIKSLNPGDVYDSETLQIKASEWVFPVESRLRGNLVDHAKWVPVTASWLDKAMSLVSAELSIMAKSIVISRFGQILMTHHNYLGQQIGVRRLIFQFTYSDLGFQFYLDISQTKFIRMPFTGDDALRECPFGLRLGLEGYISVLEGRMQMWELIHISTCQWYLCDRQDSPVAFMLDYHAEHVDQSRSYLAYKSLAHAKF